MELSDLLNKYNVVLDKIIESVGDSKNKNKIKIDLLNATYLNFAAIAGENPVIKPLLGNTTGQNLSLEEFENKVKEFQAIIQTPGFDFTGHLRKAITQTLDDFVTELEPTLAPEKVAEIRKTVSEGI